MHTKERRANIFKSTFCRIIYIMYSKNGKTKENVNV